MKMNMILCSGTRELRTNFRASRVANEPWKLNNEKQRNPWDFFERKRDFATVKFGLRKKFEKRYARVSVNERESSEKGLDILGCVDTIF